MLTQTTEWADLQSHRHAMEHVRMTDLFEQDQARYAKFHIEHEGFLFDYSKHIATQETIDKLCALARARGVHEKLQAMLKGEAINVSENRAVLHMALRGTTSPTLEVDGENVAQFVDGVLKKIKIISDDIRGNTQITDVVNIGIGGSDLGPRMAYKALKPHLSGARMHFISNIDGRSLERRLKPLNPKTTLLIIASKSFTTMETLGNATSARKWLLEAMDVKDLRNHLVAVTNNVEAALEYGLDADRILPLRDWIGGRYSLWGAVGLPVAVACGYKAFEELLEGARIADEHFINAPYEKNIGVLMGMLGVWYRNFWGYPSHAVLPYSHDLRDFPRFLQQMDMESNGKSVGIDNKPLEYPTGPIIFGESGTNAQHAFMQLMHQGTTVIPADFIFAAHAYHDLPDHHAHLVSNALAQSKALMEGQENKADLQKNFPGNRPSSTLMLDRLDPKRLGMLIALYEHKVFVQGVVWGINSFDQWGVQLGKVIAKDIYRAMGEHNLPESTDSSTCGLFKAFMDKGDIS